MPRDGLDLWRFERGLDEGERLLAADPVRAVEALERALGEWRGAPLTDVPYAPFAQAAIVRLEELRASALELRIEAELALGRHARLIGELQELVGRHPLRERLWAQLMTALYLDGRQADALAAYRSARERLIDEIGIEPGPELRRLERRILAQDPALAAEDAPTAPPARAALAVCTDGSGPAAVAERLAAASGIEAVAVALVRDAAGLADATAGLRAAAPGARTAALHQRRDRRGRRAAGRRAGRGRAAGRRRPRSTRSSPPCCARPRATSRWSPAARRRRPARSSCRSPAARTTGRPPSSGRRWAAAR